MTFRATNAKNCTFLVFICCFTKGDRDNVTDVLHLQTVISGDPFLFNLSLILRKPQAIVLITTSKNIMTPRIIIASFALGYTIGATFQYVTPHYADLVGYILLFTVGLDNLQVFLNSNTGAVEQSQIVFAELVPLLASLDYNPLLQHDQSFMLHLKSLLYQVDKKELALYLASKNFHMELDCQSIFILYSIFNLKRATSYNQKQDLNELYNN